MKPNNHQVAARSLPDRFFGASPPPFRVNKFSFAAKEINNQVYYWSVSYDLVN